MKVIDNAMEQIEKHKHSGSAELLAGAVLSACGIQNPAFNLLQASCKLDEANKERVIALLGIRQQPDFSNGDQDDAIHKIRQLMPHLFKSED